MSRKVIGVYDSEAEVKAAAEDLQQEGYAPEELFLVANENASISWLKDKTGADVKTMENKPDAVEGPETSFWDKVKAVFQGQTDFSGEGQKAGEMDLTKYGLNEAAAQEYEADVSNGRFLLLVPDSSSGSARI
ncbi:general stress protein [Alkalicoccus daliensis]|uniref:Heat induced stress protein YflT n=1 Tax=Alkalicoccus daliensis TaxID=745820 RepID=A0A1H0HS67_9BACI|nr:general stress protein [Alkalicoccus daliensis]SDO22032.1 Heat induced stress protein YflT [Alkalicoccus daliensis]